MSKVNCVNFNDSSLLTNGKSYRAFQKYYITLIEALIYSKKDNPYKSFESVLDLAYRVDFFIIELNNPDSEATFYLSEEEIEESLQTFIQAKNLLDLHLKDSLISNYKEMPISSKIEASMEVVKNYKTLPKTDFTFNDRYELFRNEFILETLSGVDLKDKIKYKF